MWNNNGYGYNCNPREEKEYICAFKGFEKRPEQEHKCCNCCKKEEKHEDVEFKCFCKPEIKREEHKCNCCEKKEEKKYDEVEVKFYLRPENQKCEYNRYNYKY